MSSTTTPLKLALAFGILWTCLASLASASIIVGEGAPARNRFPFGAKGGESTRYQQVYSAAEFPEPLNISAVKFFHDPFLGPAYPGESARAGGRHDCSATPARRQETTASGRSLKNKALGKRLLSGFHTIFVKECLVYVVDDSRCQT